MDKKITLDKSGHCYYLHLPVSGHASLFPNVFAYDVFLDHLYQRSDMHLYGYCLLTDSVHLLFKAELPPSQWLDGVLLGYLQWYQGCTGDSAYLFNDDERKLVLIQPKYLPETLKYIHHIPLIRKLCSQINQYPYTSYEDYLGRRPSRLSKERILSLISPHNGQRVRRFDDYMHGQAKVSQQYIEEGKDAFYLAYADRHYVTQALSAYNEKSTEEYEHWAKATWQVCIEQLSSCTGLDHPTLLGIRRHHTLPDAHFLLAWLYVEVAQGPIYMAAKQLGLDEATVRFNIKSIHLHHPDAYLRYLGHSLDSVHLSQPSVA